MEAGSLFVQLGLKMEGFVSGLKKATGQAEQAGKKMSGATEGTVKTIAQLEATLKNLREQFKNVQVGSQEFNRLSGEIRKTKSELDRWGRSAGENLGGANKAGSIFRGQMMKVGAAIAAAFTVDKIISFTKEVVELAGVAQGVEVAFKRIGDPTLLDELRRATQGTVSDLELMKQAVRASNFKIPLDQLASLMEFARRRAKETGESVDYLVNSIVTGIGRKSPLILDNLGISATELKDAFGGAALEAQSIGDVAMAVGKIAAAELEKMGDEAVTAADKQAQLQTQFENIKLEIGKNLIPTALKFYEVLNEIAKIASMALMTPEQAKQMAEYQVRQEAVNRDLEEYQTRLQKSDDAAETFLSTLKESVRRLEAYGRGYGELNESQQASLDTNKASIAAIEQYIRTQNLAVIVTSEMTEEQKKAAAAFDEMITKLTKMGDEIKNAWFWFGKLDKELKASDLMTGGFRLEIEDIIPADPMNVFLDTVDSGVKKNTERLMQLGKAAQIVGDSLLAPLSEAMNSVFSNLIMGSQASEGQIKELELSLKEMQQRLYQTRSGTLEFQQLKNQIDATKESLAQLQQGFAANMFDAILQAIKQLIARLAAAAATAAVLAGIITLITGGAAAGAKGFGALFKGIFSGAAGLPQFANGGIVSGPTLGLMGEYAGARSNPEVIAPLNKLQSMLGGTGGEVTFRIEGRELVGILSREGSLAKRV